MFSHNFWFVVEKDFLEGKTDGKTTAIRLWDRHRNRVPEIFEKIYTLFIDDKLTIQVTLGSKFMN